MSAQPFGCTKKVNIPPIAAALIAIAAAGVIVFSIGTALGYLNVQLIGWCLSACGLMLLYLGCAKADPRQTATMIALLVLVLFGAVSCMVSIERISFTAPLFLVISAYVGLMYTLGHLAKEHKGGGGSQ